MSLLWRLHCHGSARSVSISSVAVLTAPGVAAFCTQWTVSRSIVDVMCHEQRVFEHD